MGANKLGRGTQRKQRPRREEEKLQTQGESQYPVLLKIFKKGAGARKRRCGTEDAMERESSENKKACLEIKGMKN